LIGLQEKIHQRDTTPIKYESNSYIRYQYHSNPKLKDNKFKDLYIWCSIFSFYSIYNLDTVPAKTITKYQGSQIISYPNRWLLRLVAPWFGYVLF